MSSSETEQLKLQAFLEEKMIPNKVFSKKHTQHNLLHNANDNVIIQMGSIEFYQITQHIQIGT